MINNEELQTSEVKEWKIYLHRNKINNKCYVGQTCRKYVKTRWFKGKGYKCSAKFYNAIKKYGWDNFEHTILERNIFTLKEANIREKYWINYYNSIKNGYNIREGGNNGLNTSIYKPVAMIDMNSGVVINKFNNVIEATEFLGGDKQSSPICACCRNKTFSAYGYFWCYISQLSNWNYYEHLKLNRLCYPILKLDKTTLKPIHTYFSLKIASKELNLTVGSIMSICNSFQNDKLNYYLCYAKDYNNSWTPSFKEKKVVFKKGKVCMLNCNYEIINKFNSIKEAQSITGSHNISGCLCGTRNTTGGFYWCYECELNNFKIREPKHTKENNRKKIYQLDLNNNILNLFNSLSIASENTGVPIQNISQCAGGKRKTAGGYIWKYYNHKEEI